VAGESLARAAGLSRPTVLTCLNALEVTQAVTVLRPWSGRRTDRELVSAPKAYGFDTGFVCFARGIRELRPEDRGLLLEQLVPESLQLPTDGGCDGFQVKVSVDAFEPLGRRAFRSHYPLGRSSLVTAQTGPTYTRTLGGLEVERGSIEALRDRVARR